MQAQKHARYAVNRSVAIALHPLRKGQGTLCRNTASIDVTVSCRVVKRYLKLSRLVISKLAGGLVCAMQWLAAKPRTAKSTRAHAVLLQHTTFCVKLPCNMKHRACNSSPSLRKRACACSGPWADWIMLRAARHPRSGLQFKVVCKAQHVLQVARRRSSATASGAC